MRIFLTGATGFVGEAIAYELGMRGHSVVGLVRSELSAEKVSKAGHYVHRGDIAEPASVISAFGTVDAVIHTAFNHDFSTYTENCAADGRLLHAMSAALANTDKPLIAASATVVAGRNDVTSENDSADENIPRSASEAFLNDATRGVCTAVVRLPPSVHGSGDTAFIPALISLARATGVSAYIGEGTNRWPAVHRCDAARLFCDAVEQRRPGARYHAVAEPGIAFREIGQAIGEGLGLPVQSMSADLAEDHFGWLSMFAGMDNPASSEWTRATTGWSPREAGLIADINIAGYFDHAE